MKTFQAVADFHFIERRHDDTDFKQGSSFAVLTRGTKRPQTSNGDVGSAINSRPALYVALHAADCHMGGISIEAARRFGVYQITMDKNHGLNLGAASCRYPITDAITVSINSHPDRVPQRLALGLADGNGASEESRRVQQWIIGVGWCLRYFVLVLRNNRIIFDAAGAVRRHR